MLQSIIFCCESFFMAPFTSTGSFEILSSNESKDCPPPPAEVSLVPNLHVDMSDDLVGEDHKAEIKFVKLHFDGRAILENLDAP